jgi:hypothetical protein
MSRTIDALITYRVVKLLVTPFERTEAFKRGIIDKDGNVLIKFKDVNKLQTKNIIHCYIDLFGTSNDL